MSANAREEGSSQMTEKANKAKAAGEDMPLFIYEPSDSRNDPARKIWLCAMLLFGVCAALYVAGTMLSIQLIVLIALTIAIVGAIVLFLMYRRIRRATQPLDEKMIDEQVEQYKIDLVDTFNGYDVPYTVDDILDAADAYRERLVEEHTSVADIDTSNLGAVFRAVIGRKGKKTKDSTKDARDGQGKGDKDQGKKGKKTRSTHKSKQGKPGKPERGELARKMRE